MADGEVWDPRNEMIYDGKRMRKAVQRKLIDYNSTIAKYLTVRTATDVPFAWRGRL